MVAHLPLVDPARVRAPVLPVRGEHDGIAGMGDLLGLFGRLPNPDKRFAVLAQAAHSLGFGLNRHQYWQVVQGFLSMPRPSGPEPEGGATPPG